MFSKNLPAIADLRLYPADVHSIAGVLAGLSGPALVAAVIGGLIGWAAAWKIDALPAGLGIGLGIIGMFMALSFLAA
jgi:hypothetical protein